MHTTPIFFDYKRRNCNHQSLLADSFQQTSVHTVIPERYGRLRFLTTFNYIIQCVHTSYDQTHTNDSLMFGKTVDFA